MNEQNGQTQSTFEPATDKQRAFLSTLVIERTHEITSLTKVNFNMFRVGQLLGLEKPEGADSLNVAAYLADRAQEWIDAGCLLPERLSKKTASWLIDRVRYNVTGILEIWAIIYLTEDILADAAGYRRPVAWKISLAAEMFTAMGAGL